MKKTTLAACLALSLAAGPMQVAHAGAIAKAFTIGTIVVGGVALAKAAATKHCAANPADPQCAKLAGTDADPKLAQAPAAGAPVAAAPAPKPMDANAVIDAGAAKAKNITAKAEGWIAKKKAEYEARKAAKAGAGAPAAAPAPAPAPIPAQ